MVVFGVYIVSKSGGLIFNHDHNTPKIDTEKVFNYPVDLKLDFEAKNIVVVFGQRDGINGRRRPLCPKKMSTFPQKRSIFPEHEHGR